MFVETEVFMLPHMNVGRRPYTCRIKTAQDLGIREMQIKKKIKQSKLKSLPSQFTPEKMTIIKKSNKQMPGEGLGKKGTLFTVGRTVNCYKHIKKKKN